MSEADLDELRARMRESWERAAPSWGARAESVRQMGMPVSAWMIEHTSPQPGERVLELAAGPGDTGFLAAEIIAQPDDLSAALPGEVGRRAGGSPAGRLISSDGAEAMLEAARGRAARLGIENVEFRQLELEWIDLPAAHVDVVLCRWGLMLIVDPESALRECRRVLRPGGRIALAVWDEPETNPWATIPMRALEELGHGPPPPTGGPGMFALASGDRLQELLLDTGFLAPELDAVAISRRYPDTAGYREEMLDLSLMFRSAWAELPDTAREQLSSKLDELTGPFSAADGSLELPGRSLVAAAHA